jgi:hypothetical protein
VTSDHLPGTMRCEEIAETGIVLRLENVNTLCFEWVGEISELACVAISLFFASPEALAGDE